MAISIKTSKDGKRQYRYQQTSQRVGGKVVTKSKYLGPVNPRRTRRINPDAASDGPIGMQFTKTYGIDWDAVAKQELERQYADKAARELFAAKMYLDYGMKIDSQPSPQGLSVAPAQSAAGQAPSMSEEAAPAESFSSSDAAETF